MSKKLSKVKYARGYHVRFKPGHGVVGFHNGKTATMEGIVDRVEGAAIYVTVMVGTRPVTVHRYAEHLEMAPPVMLPIPLEAAKTIAERYGYDQVVVLARRVGEEPDPCGEHITTYGVSVKHCRVAAMMGDKLKDIAGWDTIDTLMSRIKELEQQVALYERP